MGIKIFVFQNLKINSHITTKNYEKPIELTLLNSHIQKIGQHGQNMLIILNLRVSMIGRSRYKGLMSMKISCLRTTKIFTWALNNTWLDDYEYELILLINRALSPHTTHHVRTFTMCKTLNNVHDLELINNSATLIVLNELRHED